MPTLSISFSQMKPIFTLFRVLLLLVALTTFLKQALVKIDCAKQVLYIGMETFICFSIKAQRRFLCRYNTGFLTRRTTNGWKVLRLLDHSSPQYKKLSILQEKMLFLCQLPQSNHFGIIFPKLWRICKNYLNRVTSNAMFVATKLKRILKYRKYVLTKGNTLLEMKKTRIKILNSYEDASNEADLK